MMLISLLALHACAQSIEPPTAQVAEPPAPLLTEEEQIEVDVDKVEQDLEDALSPEVRAAIEDLEQAVIASHGPEFYEEIKRTSEEARRKKAESLAAKRATEEAETEKAVEQAVAKAKAEAPVIKGDTAGGKE
jgi:hypothetical protein